MSGSTQAWSCRSHELDKAFCADMYLEGSTTSTSCSELAYSICRHEGAPPGTVLTHGFVVDSRGRRCPSLSAMVSPQDIIKITVLRY